MSWSKKYYSEALDLQYSVNMDTNEVMTSDKVKYQDSEVLAIGRTGGHSRTLHNIKKVFSGVIVDNLCITDIQ